MSKHVMALLILIMSLPTFADDKTSKEEMMKKWQEFSTPGDAHKFLAGFEGKWTFTQKMWETKDAKPQESTGTASMKMILGGRYLQQEIKGKAMGQDFEGMGLTGYDNLKKQTVSTWADNMGTSILFGTGSLDTAKKTVSEKGEFTCPMEKNHTANYRSEWVMTDKNTMTFTMFRKLEDKNEFKMMEMLYKRVK